MAGLLDAFRTQPHILWGSNAKEKQHTSQECEIVSASTQNSIVLIYDAPSAILVPDMSTGWPIGRWNYQ